MRRCARTWGAARGAARIHSENDELGAARGADTDCLFVLNASRLKDNMVCGNVHNSQNILSITPFIDASYKHSPQTPLPFAQAQNLLATEHDYYDSLEHSEMLDNFKFDDGSRIDPKILFRWKNKYGLAPIAASMSYLKEFSQENFVKSPMGFLTSCLENKYWETKNTRTRARLADEFHKDRLKQNEG